MSARGVIELGGTKTLVAAGGQPSELTPVRIETTEPMATISAAVSHLGDSDVDIVGVASFGPLDLDRDSSTYGRMLNTPKRAWIGFDLKGELERSLGVPVVIDTDVNAAALGETVWGALRGTTVGAYVTVGTGIGGGVVIDGHPLHGAPHPEIGHVVVRRHPDDEHRGSCPFHGDCLEGMASGPAIADRFGARPEELGPDQTGRVVELLAYYLGQGMRDLVYTWAPDRIVVGGGLSRLEGFHEAVAFELGRQLAAYPVASPRLDDFLVPPALGDISGLVGALALIDQDHV